MPDHPVQGGAVPAPSRARHQADDIGEGEDGKGGRKRGQRTFWLQQTVGPAIIGGMPRHVPAALGGYCYHVLNRGNARRTVFHKEADYAAFAKLLRQAGERTDVRLLAWCLLPNHLHLVLWPRADGDLSAYMGWLLTAHVRRYHQHYHSTGHVWQGRFRGFPIQDDDHLLTVLRYVERNPVRAGLVASARDWRWSSMGVGGAAALSLDPGPVPRPTDWLTHVDTPQTPAEVESLRECIRRRRPFGTADWAVRTASPLGLDASLRPLGRPRKAAPPPQPTLFAEPPT